MNIALIGYGQMGRMIEAAAKARKHRIVAAVDPFVSDMDGIQFPVYPDIPSAKTALKDADVAIEFTRPDTAISNIKALMQVPVPGVVGTTGWHDAMDKVMSLVKEADSSLLWASNFSLGVNLFYRIAAHTAAIMDEFPEYDVGGWESHHKKKADSPSGTAKTLVERVLANMKRKKKPVWETLNRAPEPDELHYPSLRVGAVPGTHSLFFDSSADTIELTHTARSREGFAQGAVRAAEWLAACSGPGEAAKGGRKGIFTMDDVLSDIL